MQGWHAHSSGETPDEGLGFELLAELSGGRSRGRTDTFSEERQILSLVRLPIPPFGHEFHSNT